MRKECENTRKSLRRYLRGRLFRRQRQRIERHFGACALCRSELEALRHAEKTKRLLKDISAPGGAGRKLRDGIYLLSGAGKLFYRPFWLAGIAICCAVLYYGVISAGRVPFLNEGVDGMDAPKHVLSSAQTSTPAVAAAVQPQAVVAPPAAVVMQAEAQTAAPAAEAKDDPLVVTVAADDEPAAIKRINEVIRGHGSLRKMRLTETVKEISGRMTSRELLTFFSRIGGAGRIQYSRSRFESFPSAESIPFVLKLKGSLRSVSGASEPGMKNHAASATGATPEGGKEKPAPAATTTR